MNADEAKKVLQNYEGHSHMVGFEAFGTEHDEPIVRLLGEVTFNKKKEIVMKPDPEPSEWPEAELTGGVAYVKIETHGDFPQGAFIYVCGTNKKAVELMWHRAKKAFLDCAGNLWQSTAADSV